MNVIYCFLIFSWGFPTKRQELFQKHNDILSQPLPCKNCDRPLKYRTIKYQCISKRQTISKDKNKVLYHMCLISGITFGI